MVKLTQSEQRQQKFRDSYPKMVQKLRSPEAIAGLRTVARQVEDVAHQVELAARTKDTSQANRSDEYQIVISI